jgi:hypothetical protein
MWHVLLRVARAVAHAVLSVFVLSVCFFGELSVCVVWQPLSVWFGSRCLCGLAARQSFDRSFFEMTVTVA